MLHQIGSVTGARQLKCDLHASTTSFWHCPSARATPVPSNKYCTRQRLKVSAQLTEYSHEGVLASLSCLFANITRRKQVLLAVLPDSALQRQVESATSHASEIDWASASRRAVLAAGIGTGLRWAPGAEAAESVDFINSAQGYRLLRPAGWEQTGKAGADALFADPARKSNTLGVTVSPIRIASLDKFGTVEAIGEKLLAAEKAKESTLGVAMLSESSRTGPSGVLIYDFDYELNSTRGRKRVLSTVAVANRKLYIFNGNFKCGESGCDADSESFRDMQNSAASFDVIVS